MKRVALLVPLALLVWWIWRPASVAPPVAVARDLGSATRVIGAIPRSRPVAPRDMTMLDPSMLLAGQVIDASGQEAAGATIFIHGVDVGVTDAHGWFGVLVDTGRHDVAARRGDFCAELDHRVYVGPDKNDSIDDPILIVLARGRTIAGTVRDARGKPIAGAKIGVDSEQRDSEATSDTDGKYRFTGICDVSQVSVRADGFISDSRAFDLVHDDIAFDFVLEAGRPLRGRVLAYNGAIVADARLMLFSPGEHSHLFTAFTYSRSDGSFVFDDVPPGAMELDVDAPNQPQGHFEVTVTDSRNQPEMTLRLERGESIYGRVVDATGVGVGGVMLSTLDANTISDSDGTFTLDGLERNDAVSIQARLDWPHASANVTVTSGAAEGEVTIVLHLHDQTLRGRTQYADGTGARGYRLRVISLFDPQLENIVVGDVDADGRFAIGDLTDGECRVELSPAIPDRAAISTPCNASELVIIVPRRARVSGDVVGGSRTSPIVARLDSVDEEPIAIGLLDGSNRFTIENVAAGTYRICASDALGDGEFQTITVRESDTIANLHLRFNGR